MGKVRRLLSSPDDDSNFEMEGYASRWFDRCYETCALSFRETSCRAETQDQSSNDVTAQRRASLSVTLYEQRMEPETILKANSLTFRSS